MNNSKIIVKEIRERIKTVRIEKGHTRIHLEKFIDIANVLEVEVSDLFNGPDHVYVFSSYYKKKHIRRL